MDQRPKQSETHSSSTFPQDSDSDSDSESEIELRSTHTSPETTTSEESDGTLVDTSSSTTPTPSLLGEGDLDSTEGHSQSSVGTLPLTDKNSPVNVTPKGSSSQEEQHSQGPSETTPTNSLLKKISENPLGLGDEFEKGAQNSVKPRQETEQLEQIKTTSPSKDKTQSGSPDDPFSRFWLGQIANTSSKCGRGPRWLDNKPERRHSVELEALDKQDHRPYRYVLRRERPLFPRPKFYSKCPNTEGVSLEYVEFILQHIVLQRLREKEEGNLECEKRKSEIRRQSELPTDLTGKPRRVIQVDPIISPFDSGEDKTPEEDTYIPPWSPNAHRHQTQFQGIHHDHHQSILQRDPPFPHQRFHQLDPFKLQPPQKVQKLQVAHQHQDIQFHTKYQLALESHRIVNLIPS